MIDMMKEDVVYIQNEYSNNIGLVVGEMLNIIDENKQIHSNLKNQKWYNRMIYTVLGKNKASHEEIKANHDKLSEYVCYAVEALYEQNSISAKEIVVLGNRINALYKNQNELKILLGNMVTKLNEKIESVDNYHILLHELEQGCVGENNDLFLMGYIIANVDLRCAYDDRKVKLLKQTVRNNCLFADEKKLLVDYLVSFEQIAPSEIGKLYMLFSNIENNCYASLIVQVIAEYFFLGDMEKNMKSPNAIVKKVLEDNQINTQYEVLGFELFEMLLDDYILQIKENEIRKEIDEENSRIALIVKYFSTIENYLMFWKEVPKCWNNDQGDFQSTVQIEAYSKYMMEVFDNMDPSAYTGRVIRENFNNIVKIGQNIISHYEECYMSMCDQIEEVAIWEHRDTSSYSGLLDLGDNDEVTYRNIKLIDKDLRIYVENIGEEKIDRAISLGEVFEKYYMQHFETPGHGCSRENFSIDKITEYADRGVIKLTCYCTFDQVICKVIEKYRDLFGYMKDYIISNIECFDIQWMERQIKDFPIIWEEEKMRAILGREGSLVDCPIIGFQKKKNDSDEYYDCGIGYGTVHYEGTGKLYFKISFNGFGDNYTPVWAVLEQEGGVVNNQTFEFEKYEDFCKIEWGDWISDNEIELVVTNPILQEY